MDTKANRLAAGIAEVCRGHRLTEKRLVAPSRRVGLQWLDAVARSGTPVANARVTTLRGFALDLASPEMIRTGRQYLSRHAGPLLVGSIWSRQEDPAAYIFSLKASRSLLETVYATLCALRAAAIRPGQLRRRQLEAPAKSAEMAVLLDAYEKALHESGLVDYADVLRMAAARVKALAREETRKQGGAPFLVLVPQDIVPAYLEEQLLAAAPKEWLCRLPVDEPCAVDPALPATDASLLRWLPAPADAAEPRGDGTARFFHAAGEVNEVREVLRRCLDGQIPLDRVELLYTDGAAYLPVLYETADRLGTVAGTGLPRLPVTYAEGVPIRYFRPGRALTGWLDWWAADCPQKLLIHMLRDGLLEPPKGGGETLSGGRLADLLASVPIVFGRDRTLACVDAEVKALERRLAQSSSPEAEDPDEEARAALQRQLAQMRALLALVGALLDVTPRPGAKPPVVLAAAIDFLSHMARCRSELDGYARKRLVTEIREAARLVEQGETEGYDAVRFLRSLPGDLVVGGRGPRPGHLYAAPLRGGGHSGRPHTFIVGLDDRRFPGAGLQDPLLLDSERATVSKRLRTAGERLQERLDDLARLLARLRGTVTFSFPSRDLLEDRESFPCSSLLDAYRVVSGRRDADIAAFMEALGPAASFLAPGDAGCADATEWWLRRLCGDAPPSDPSGAVFERFPHLARGLAATDARYSEAFTEHDGLVPEAGRAHDPTRRDGPVMSPSRLEKAATCPLAYFFHYVLGVQPAAELEIDPTVWLDPLQFGSLLHDVLCRFMRDLQADGKLPPVAKRDAGRLDAILEDCLRAFERKHPRPSDLAYERQAARLREAMRIFLASEEKYCLERRPLYLEASLGLESFEGETPIDTTQPIPVALPGKRRIRVRGRIDRVDAIGGGEDRLVIQDYKSGSSWRVDQDPPFNRGRTIQPVLYLRMLTERLKQRKVPGEVVEAGYFYPTGKGDGRRVLFSAAELAPGLRIVQDLADTIAAGAFVCGSEGRDCEFCDYEPICGCDPGLAEAARRKLEAGDCDALGPFRRVRGVGD